MGCRACKLCSVVLGLALTFVLFSGLSRVAAAEPQELEEKLKRIRTGVESAEASIVRMKEEFSALLAKRAQLEESLKKLRSEDKSIQKNVAELKDKAGLLATEVTASEMRVAEQQRKIQARLRAMYVNTAVSMNPVMSGRAARGDMERLSFFARKVRDFDSRLFKSAAQAVEALMVSRSALDQSLETEEKLRDQLQSKRKEAERESVKLKSVTGQLVVKQKAAQDSLALLQDEAKKVEDMIASLTSGEAEEDDEQTEPQEDEEDSKDAKDEQPIEPSSEVKMQPEAPTIQKTVVHPSLFDSGSKISAPVKGEVLQTFGRSKLTNFADIVRSKGIEFSTPTGSDVHVVLSGKVVFAGVMPGYEQVIVVEHGGRSYSLYGRLGTIAVKSGDIIEQDQTIATTTTPDAKGRNFYFEVRKNGTPVNPETVLVKVSR